MLTLKHLIEKLNENLEILNIRENEALSLPFYSLNDGVAVPTVFVYAIRYSDEHGAMFSIKNVFIFISDNPEDFLQKPLKDIVLLNVENSFFFISETLNDTSLDEMYSGTVEALSKVKWNDDISATQANEICRLFNAVVPHSLREYYFSIGQEYFVWLNSKLNQQ